MSRVRATATPDRASGLHVVAPRASSGERAAGEAAERAVATWGPATWSFAAVPIHAAVPGEGGVAGVTNDGPLVDARLDGPGRQLPRDVVGRVPGIDPASVRVHDDAAAADLALRAGADAVTVGRDIAFAPGRLDLHSRAGRRRLVHELTHVAQQARQPGRAVVHRDGDKDVSRPTTLAGLPEADRKQLQVVSTTPVEAQASGQLKSAFQASSVSSPADEVVADASVPKAVAQALVNLAADWSHGGTKATLKPNQTLTVELDLTPYKGRKGLFRFTYTSPAAKKGAKARSRILVEGLGSATRPAGVSVSDKIKAASITSSGYSATEKQALREAIGQVPASHLAIVKGLKFRRDTVHKPDPKVAGLYDEDTHTITMFDNAFSATQVVFDEGGVATSYAAKQIVHEIGHAVDLAPLRAAWLVAEKARQEMNAKAGTFGSKAEKDAFEKAKQASGQADSALAKARSRSGTKPVTKGTTTTYQIGKGHQGIPFRQAVRKDGSNVSKYGDKDWQESYAEAYSLYLTQPTLLKRIRPATYQHLEKTLPK